MVKNNKIKQKKESFDSWKEGYDYRVSEEKDLFYAVLVLGGFLFLLFILSLFVDMDKHNYKIYKTECHNEERLLYSSIVQKSFYIDNKNESFNITNLPKYINITINGKDLQMSCKDSSQYIDINGKLIPISDKHYSQCNFYGNEEICNKTKVNELFYADTSCISHSGNQEYALLNCFSRAKEQDLSEGWLFQHGECLEHTCGCGLGKGVCSKDFMGWKSECHKIICSKYKVQDYEVEMR